MILSDVALRAALLVIPSSPYNRDCVRRVDARHLLKPNPLPLWAEGSRTQGARYTPVGSADALYLAEDPYTAVAEASAPITLPTLPAQAYVNQPVVEFTARCVLHQVLDLTVPAHQMQLETNYQELTGFWRELQDAGQTAPTQRLGDQAFHSRRFQAIRFPSSKLRPRGVCIAIFVDLLVPGADFVEVIDPYGKLVSRIP
jgi:RES domain-containing protein